MVSRGIMVAENHDDAPAAAPSLGRSCPICGKPSSREVRPFCSKRCADIDLHRWLGGVYAIPESEAPEGPVGEGESEAS